MKIEYHFLFTEDHLITSLQRYRQQIGWLRPFLKFRWRFVLLFSVLWVFFAYQGLPIVAGGFGIAAGLLWICGTLNASLLRRQFRKSPFRNETITFSLSENGSHAVGRTSEVRLGWETFTKARRFDDGLLLFQGPNAFNWLPDTAAVDAASIAAAQELVRSRIQDYRNV